MANNIAFNTEELGYIAPEEAHTKVFEGLTSEKQIAKYKDALGMLKPNNQLWLCIAILRYRNNGFISKNKNPFMQEIFRDLVGLKGLKSSKGLKGDVLEAKTPQTSQTIQTSEATQTPATGSFLSRLINKIF